MLKPALLIIAGRIAGFVAAFVTPLILVRLFDLETFGTYKQWFLLYITLLTMTQIGMSESLLYFLPRADGEAGRYVMNSVLFLTGVGAAAAVVLVLNAGAIARWMSNPALEPLIPLLAVYLLLMQASIGLETVMTARSAYQVGGSRLCGHRPDPGALSHRAGPACAIAALSAAMGPWLSLSFGSLYTAHYFWRTFGASFRPDARLFHPATGVCPAVRPGRRGEHRAGKLSPICRVGTLRCGHLRRSIRSDVCRFRSSTSWRPPSATS